jgi:hypothetical protein
MSDDTRIIECDIHLYTALAYCLQVDELHVEETGTVDGRPLTGRRGIVLFTAGGRKLVFMKPETT